MQHLRREYTLPRNDEGTRVRGWIRSKTRIGPVLNIKVCQRDEPYSVEVQASSIFQDNTVSWVRIVNGVDKDVTESMLTKEEEDIASEKPIAKARPRQKPAVTLTSISIPVLERIWIDNDTQTILKSEKQSLDYCDMINQFLEESTERSTTTTSLNGAGGRSRRRFAMVAWRLYIKAGKGRRSKEHIPMLCESKLPQSIPVPSSNSRTFRRKCY